MATFSWYTEKKTLEFEGPDVCRARIIQASAPRVLYSGTPCIDDYRDFIHNNLRKCEALLFSPSLESFYLSDIKSELVLVENTRRSNNAYVCSVLFNEKFLPLQISAILMHIPHSNLEPAVFLFNTYPKGEPIRLEEGSKTIDVLASEEAQKEVA